MKRVLLVGSMASMIANFNKNNLKILTDLGCEVHVAANFGQEDPISRQKRQTFIDFLEKNHITYVHVPFPRGIGGLRDNLSILKSLNQLFLHNSYDLVHTNSPLASILVRMVAKKHRVPVLYTVHGFQFYQGASKKDWLLYYTVERLFAPLTTSLITINQEDYNRANTMGYKNVNYLPGVGIELSSFEPKDSTSSDKFSDKYVIVSVGELNDNKNQLCVLKALCQSELKEQIHYFICGVGENTKIYQTFIKENGLEEIVTLLGYQEDVKPILNKSDVFVFPSFREGLSVAVMEAMASKKAVFASRIRGNVDLIDEGKGGQLFAPDDSEILAGLFDQFLPQRDLLQQYGSYNERKIEQFSQAVVDEKMRSIYAALLGEQISDVN